MRRITTMLIAAGITLALAGCSGGAVGEAAAGRVTHVVLCWLKEPGNPQQRAQLVEVSRTFSEIPGVLEVKAGTVVPSDRDIVDDSFDVGISLTFAGVEAMNTYLVHPKHKAAVSEVLMPLVEKIRVHDFVE